MKYYFILLYCIMMMSCATIPDQAFHNIVCKDTESCTVSELEASVQPITNMVMVNGISTFREDQVRLARGDTVDHTSFHLLFLEYAESGERFEDNRQLEVIKRAIDTSKKPIYLVIYVNSWNNNASTIEPSPDLISFPYLLARRSFQNPDMNIIGVYVGWRGKKYKHFPATILSVKDRAKVADAIGKRGQVRADIISLVNTIQSNRHSGYTLIIGKSFGGRLLSRAFIDDLTGIKTVKEWPLGNRSLLVTLNSAIGADAFDQIYCDMPTPDPSSGLQLQRPLWINLTSKDDWITKTMFPKARLIGQKLSDLRKKRTIGHYMPYLSHSVFIETSNSLDDKPECEVTNSTQQSDTLSSTIPIESWFEIPLKNPKYHKVSPSHKSKDTNRDEVKKGCQETRYIYENKKSREVGNRYYTTVLRPLHQNSAENLGYMWNFQTDESLIGYTTEEAKVIKNSGKHNAYVKTMLGRMADDMLFTLPEQ